MTKIDLINDIKEVLKIYKEFNPIIGGSAALYLQNDCTRFPHDIDIFINIDKSKFLNLINSKGIRIPKLI